MSNKSHIQMLIFILFVCFVSSAPFYRTLLYGEKLKGFVTISPADNKNEMYIVSFDIKEQPNCTLIWAVHTSSAPYDMAVMTDNCRRVKKSPPIVKNMPVVDSTISSDGLAGNTLVISGDNSEVLACATIIIPGKELMHAVFHEEPVEGHIHIIPTKNNAVRLLPDLKYMKKFDFVEPKKNVMTWAFVDSCSSNNSVQYTDGSEVGVDSRATFGFELPNNYTIKALALYCDNKFFACASIVNVEPRTLKGLGIILKQKHYFEPVFGIGLPPNELHIRDDCLDISTEIIHKNYEKYYPSVNIFGSESIMLKSVVHNKVCGPLRPQFARPIAIANFIHPIIGRISLVDTDDKILLTGELRNIFDEMSTRATIMVSNETASSSTCSHITSCDLCKKVEDAAIIVGKNETVVAMAGVFDWFNITSMKSAIIDLEWLKVCANLTILPSGSLPIHALVKRIGPFNSPTVASIVALEYPANNYTEILINKKQQFTDIAAHYRPLDRSITNGPPCGEQNLGGIVKVSWIDKLKQKLISPDNDSSVIFDEKFVTGVTSMLGTSVILKKDKEVYCGYFEPISEKTIAFAEFGEPFVGYIKLTQYATSNWEAGFPTEVYYSLKYTNKTDPNINTESIIWEVVNQQNMICKNALIFNPLQVEESECSRQNFEFCPIGSAANRSKPLLMHARRHLTAQGLPLSGPYSVIGKSIRLRSMKNKENIGCYPLKLVSEATFRWVVYTNISLSSVQKQVSIKTGVPTYKIEVDYTRELYQSRCTIYRITILDEDQKLEKILNSIDIGERKFKNDTDLVCNGTELSVEPKTKEPTSSLIKFSVSEPFSFFVVLMFFFFHFLAFL